MRVGRRGQYNLEILVLKFSDLLNPASNGLMVQPLAIVGQQGTTNFYDPTPTAGRRFHYFIHDISNFFEVLSIVSKALRAVNDVDLVIVILIHVAKLLLSSFLLLTL